MIKALCFAAPILFTAVVCGGCAHMAHRVEAVLAEYAAEYPETPDESAIKVEDLSDREAMLKEIRRSRGVWAQTMEPYVARIREMGTGSAAALAEISRSDRREIRNVTDNEDMSEKEKSREYGRLIQRINLAVYALEKMGPEGVAALASLLKDSSVFTNIGLSLGMLGQKELLLRYFTNKSLTDFERINSAMGLTYCYGETEPVPFLVDFIIEHEQEEEQQEDFHWSQMLSASIALEPVSEETIRYLTEKIEKESITELPAPYLGFLAEHGLDLQKAMRVYPESKGTGGLLLVHPTDPLPEEKIKKFLAGLRTGKDNKLDLVIEVGRRVQYKALNRLMTLCEEAGVYSIEVKSHHLDLGFSTYLLARPFKTVLNRPGKDFSPTFQALFMEIKLLPAEGKKLECLVKVGQGGLPGKTLHEDFKLSTEMTWDLLTASRPEKLIKHIGDKRSNFWSTTDFESLPVVLVIPPEAPMDLVLAIADTVQTAFVKDISFLHHTRGGDWIEAFKKKEQFRTPRVEPGSEDDKNDK